MSQPNLLELAKQGHPKAIESLINRQMQPKGITAKVALKNNCLHIMLEAAQPPDQKALVPVIRKGITNLGVPSIELLKIYGKQTGEQVPAWSQEFELVGKSSPSANSENIETPPKELSLKERAKQGDVEAITKLLNVALLNRNITSKATLKDGCLSIMLESSQVPDQEVSTKILSRELSNLKVKSIKLVKVYGKQMGEEFPHWSEEFELEEKSLYISKLAATQSTNLNVSKQPQITNDKLVLKIASGVLLAVFTILVLAGAIPILGTMISILSGNTDLDEWSRESKNSTDALRKSWVDSALSSCQSKDYTESETPKNCKIISKGEFGNEWPFTVQEGTLVCALGDMVLNVGDNYYALNNSAVNSGIYLNVEQIQRDEPVYPPLPFPSKKVPIQPIIDRGCR